MTTETETVFDVAGMHCGSCVGRITTALQGVDGIAAVQVHLDDGSVAVRHDAVRMPISAVIQTLRGSGYDATPRGPSHKPSRRGAGCCG